MALTGLVGACASYHHLIEDLTGNSGPKFKGVREDALGTDATRQSQLATAPVVIPAAVTNQSWPQPGGAPSNVMQNLTLNINLRTVFSVDAGRGSDSDGKITAPPIVVGGRVYVLDSGAKVIDATVVAKSITTGGPSADGTATAIGLVLSSVSSPPQGGRWLPLPTAA